MDNVSALKSTVGNNAITSSIIATAAVIVVAIAISIIFKGSLPLAAVISLGSAFIISESFIAYCYISVKKHKTASANGRLIENIPLHTSEVADDERQEGPSPIGDQPPVEIVRQRPAVVEERFGLALHELPTGEEGKERRIEELRALIGTLDDSDADVMRKLGASDQQEFLEHMLRLQEQERKAEEAGVSGFCAIISTNEGCHLAVTLHTLATLGSVDLSGFDIDVACPKRVDESDEQRRERVFREREAFHKFYEHLQNAWVLPKESLEDIRNRIGEYLGKSEATEPRQRKKVHEEFMSAQTDVSDTLEDVRQYLALPSTVLNIISLEDSELNPWVSGNVVDFTSILQNRRAAPSMLINFPLALPRLQEARRGILALPLTLTQSVNHDEEIHYYLESICLYKERHYCLVLFNPKDQEYYYYNPRWKAVGEMSVPGKYKIEGLRQLLSDIWANHDKTLEQMGAIIEAAKANSQSLREFLEEYDLSMPYIRSVSYRRKTADERMVPSMV